MREAVVYLLVAEPRDPVTGVAQTVRLAGGGKRGYRQFGEVRWNAGLEPPPPIVHRLGYDDGQYGEGSIAQAVVMRYGSSRKRAAQLAKLYWRDASFTLYKGPDGDDGSNFEVILTGNFADVTVDGAKLNLQMTDPSILLTKPILAGASFAGTGGKEGVAELKGRPRRRAFGRCRNVELWALDPANNIWVATDPDRPLLSIDQLYDRGNAASSVVNVAWAGSVAATLAALAATACPEGGGAAAPSIGCVKWWYANPGKLSCDLRGEIGAGYKDKVADLAAWLLAAVSGPAINAGALAAAQAARPDEIGYLVDDDKSVSTALNEVLSGASLWWGMNTATEVAIGQWNWAASSGAIKAARVSRVRTHKPVSKLTVGYRTNHLVMSRGDIAASLLIEDPAILAIPEKIGMGLSEQTRQTRYTYVSGRASALGISVGALNSARTDWLTHRNAQDPAWDSTGIETTLSNGRATWNAYQQAYEAQLAAYERLISESDGRTAIIGNGVTDINGNPIAVENVANNLALLDWWKEGAAIPWGLNPASATNTIYAFPRAGWPAEVTGPMGTQDDCWYCEDSDGGTGGGWNGGQVRPLDPDKTYRFVVPIMHGGNSAGNAYWGCTNVCDLNTTTSASNPYFCVLNHSQMVQHRWYLFVGYIYPRNGSGKTHTDAGVWDTVTGQRLTVDTALNFCFRPDGTQPTHRAYQYYVGGTSYQMFGKPLIECIDGTQSDLRGYFRPGALTYNVAQKLTAIGPATIKIEGTTASKTSGGGFDAAVRGERIFGPIYASATIRQEDGHTMVGFATGAGQYDRPDAKFYIQYRWATGAVEIWTGGASPAWTGTIAANLAGEVMVTYDQRGYSATVSGVQVGGFFAALPNLAHYPVFYIYEGNATILGLRYGPATDNLTAAGDITIVPISSNLLAVGNTVSPIVPENWSVWKTRETFKGGVKFSYRPRIRNGLCNGLVAVMPADPGGDGDPYGYSPGGYGFYSYNAGSNLFAIINGNPTAVDLGSWADGDLLELWIDNQQAQWFRNGTKVWPTSGTVAVTSDQIWRLTGQQWTGVSTELRVRPYSDNLTATGQITKLTSMNTAYGEVVGNTLRNKTGSTGYAASAVGERIFGAAYVEAEMPPSGQYLMLSFDDDVTGYDFADQRISFHVLDTTISVYQLGVYFGGWTIAASAGKMVRASYDGGAFSISVDGAKIGIDIPAPLVARYYPKVTAYTAGSIIRRIAYGPFSDNTIAKGDVDLYDPLGADQHYKVSGNSIQKVTTNAWDTNFYTRQSSYGSAFVQGRLSTVDTFLGLTTYPGSTGGSYPLLCNAVHRSGNGNWYSYPDGAPRVNMGTSRNGVTFSNNTDWLIVCDGVWSIIYADGVEMDRFKTFSYHKNTFLYGGGSGYAVGSRIDAIRFGPWSQNDFAFIKDSPTSPEVYATSADNMLVNGSFSTKLEPWFAYTVSGSPAYRNAGTTGDPSSGYVVFPPGGQNYLISQNNEIRPLLGAKKLYLTADVYRPPGVTSGNISGIIRYYKPDGTPSSIKAYDAPTLTPSALGWSIGQSAVGTPPSDASGWSFDLYADPSGASLVATNVRLAKTETAADVTSLITGPALVEIACTSDGTAKTGQLPKAVNFQLNRNGVDVTAPATWTVDAVVSGSVTASFTSGGVLSVTAIGASKNRIRVKAAYQGASRTFELDINKNTDPAPTGGGGSGGGTSATVAITFNSNTTAMGINSGGGELEFQTGASGTATMTGTVLFESDGGSPASTYGAYWRWQKWNGSSWVDQGSATFCTVTTQVISYYDDFLNDTIYQTYRVGELNVSAVFTGLGASTTVKFRLRMACQYNGRTLYFYSDPNIGGTGS